jgi:hypothetical protein
MSEQHSGSCNCGGVRFVASGQLRAVIYCHCGQCRKQTGHFWAATNVADRDLQIIGEENLTWYRSSDFARRGFCRHCGSALFWKPNGGGYTSIGAGVFDSPTGLQPDRHIFVADQGDYYAIDDHLPQYERSTPDIKVAGD